MALPEWPEWMPNPLQSSFTLQSVDTRTLSQMEKSTLIRREFDSDELEANATILLSPLEAGWFEKFVHKQLLGGSQWFIFPLWIGGEVQRQPCRFKTLPKISNVNALYTKYDFVLQVEERDFMSDDLYEFLNSYSPTDLGKIFNAVHRTVFDILPLSTLLWPEVPTFVAIDDLALSTHLIEELPPSIVSCLDVSTSLKGDYSNLSDLGSLSSAINSLNGSTRTHHVLFHPNESLNIVPDLNIAYPIVGI